MKGVIRRLCSYAFAVGEGCMLLAACTMHAWLALVARLFCINYFSIACYLQHVAFSLMFFSFCEDCAGISCLYGHHCLNFGDKQSVLQLVLCF